MILAVDFGVVRLTCGDGSTRIAVCSAGFLEVHDNKLNAFFDICRWEEDIESAKEEAERLRESECESLKAHRRNAVELARAVADISRATGKKIQ